MARQKRELRGDPFESKAQAREMFANQPKIAKRWAKETPNMKDLPEKAKTKKSDGPGGAHVATRMISGSRGGGGGGGGGKAFHGNQYTSGGGGGGGSGAGAAREAAGKALAQKAAAGAAAGKADGVLFRRQTEAIDSWQKEEPIEHGEPEALVKPMTGDDMRKDAKTPEPTSMDAAMRAFGRSMEKHGDALKGGKPDLHESHGELMQTLGELKAHHEAGDHEAAGEALESLEEGLKSHGKALQKHGDADALASHSKMLHDFGALKAHHGHESSEEEDKRDGLEQVDDGQCTTERTTKETIVTTTDAKAKDEDDKRDAASGAGESGSSSESEEEESAKDVKGRKQAKGDGKKDDDDYDRKDAKAEEKDDSDPNAGGTLTEGSPGFKEPAPGKLYGDPKQQPIAAAKSPSSTGTNPEGSEFGKNASFSGESDGTPSGTIGKAAASPTVPGPVETDKGTVFSNTEFTRGDDRDLMDDSSPTPDAMNDWADNQRARADGARNLPGLEQQDPVTNVLPSHYERSPDLGNPEGGKYK